MHRWNYPPWSLEEVPKTRKEAQAIGSRWYFPNTCKVGHQAPRYTNNGACSECIKPNYKNRRAKDPEKVKAQNHATYRRWFEKNPDHVRKIKVINEHKRRAKIAKSEGSFTREDIDEIRKLQKGKCAYCKKKLGKKERVDHIKAVGKGGSNYPSNLQLLCEHCNVSKKDRDPIDHMQKMGMLL